jgi:hypothetical protein
MDADWDFDAAADEQEHDTDIMFESSPPDASWEPELDPGIPPEMCIGIGMEQDCVEAAPPDASWESELDPGLSPEMCIGTGMEQDCVEAGQPKRIRLWGHRQNVVQGKRVGKG